MRLVGIFLTLAAALKECRAQIGKGMVFHIANTKASYVVYVESVG